MQGTLMFLCFISFVVFTFFLINYFNRLSKRNSRSESRDRLVTILLSLINGLLFTFAVFLVKIINSHTNMSAGFFETFILTSCTVIVATEYFIFFRSELPFHFSILCATAINICTTGTISYLILKGMNLENGTINNFEFFLGLTFLAFILATIMLIILTYIKKVPNDDISYLFYYKKTRWFIAMYFLLFSALMVTSLGILFSYCDSGEVDGSGVFIERISSIIYIVFSTIKTVVITASCYAITIYLAITTRKTRDNVQLLMNLNKEKSYRKSLLKDRGVGFTANLTKNTFEEGEEYFAKFINNGLKKYDSIIEVCINTFVHPYDKEIMKKLGSAEALLPMFEKSPVISFRCRLQVSGLLENFYFPEAIMQGLQQEQNVWAWFEVQLALTFDSSTNMHYLYVTVSNINETVKEEKKLQKAATHDYLTGIANRASFVDSVCKYLKDPKALGAMIIVDVDYLKAVNDTFGHPSGDKLLMNVSYALQDVFRSSDYIARIGGDEFAVFVRGPVNTALLSKKFEEINDAIHQEFVYKNSKVATSISAGVAILSDVENNNYDELYRNADRALYDAKKSGKGCLKFYH